MKITIHLLTTLLILFFQKAIAQQALNQILPPCYVKIIQDQSTSLPNNTQMAIAVINGEKIDYFGVLKKDSLLYYVKNDSKLFEIGSITKVFTSTVLASLIKEGDIDMDEAVNRYYKFPFKDHIQLSFKALANHTAGLPAIPTNVDMKKVDLSNPYKNYGAADLENYLKDYLTLENRPDTKSVYSNLGVAILGYTLGLTQQTTYQALVKERIFKRFHMKDSYFSSRNLGDKLVHGLDADGQVVPNWDFDVFASAGGIVSNVRDLAKFALAQFDTANIDLQLTHEPTFKIDEDLSIGLGWYILTMDYGKTLIRHSGNTAGYSSSIAVDPKHKKAVVILSNISGTGEYGDNPQHICLSLMKEINQ